MQFSSSAMGGVRFEMDPAHYLVSAGDSIAISISPPDSEKGWEMASVGLITQTADGSPIDSAERLLELVATAAPDIDVTPTGTTIDLLGFELTGYDIRAEPPTENLYTFAVDRFGGPTNTVFGYFPNARIFVADTPAGVLVAGSSNATAEEGLADIEPTLNSLLGSIEFTGGGLSTPLPLGQQVRPNDVIASEARGPLNPDGPPALDASFSSIKPGSYQIRNFGRTFSVDIGEQWWVQPNTRGQVSLSSPRNGGPGDRDLSFLAGVMDLMPVASGPVSAGEPVVVATSDEVIEVLSQKLDVRDVQVVDLGGLSATRFDVSLRSDESCTQSDPCEYVFRTTSGAVMALRATHTHRIWWLDEGLDSPSLILSMTPRGDDFNQRTTELLKTLTFNG